jgi:hypothetical protein
MASGEFQALLYKAEIEAALRTPGFGGFALLDLHDFPGQGTAPVGVLNALWQNKGYITAEQYRRFCNDVVPLARMAKRAFTTDESFEAVIDVANYGPRDLVDSLVQWTLCKTSGRAVAEGCLAVERIATEGLTRAGQIVVPLASVSAAAKLNLECRIQGTSFANDWDIWVYPVRVESAEPSNVMVTRDVDEAMQGLRTGGRVLLVLDASRVTGPTQASFAPIFWNRITFPRNRVHTMGILCDPDHPAFADFPTDFHSNWQWQDLLQRAKPMIVDDLPRELVPIVRSIDDWNDARNLAVLFEARLGEGRLMLSTVDVVGGLSTRPIARQLRHSMLAYMASDRFDPSVALTTEQIRSLLN